MGDVIEPPDINDEGSKEDTLHCSFETDSIELEPCKIGASSPSTTYFDSVIADDDEGLIGIFLAVLIGLKRTVGGGRLDLSTGTMLTLDKNSLDAFVTVAASTPS